MDNYDNFVDDDCRDDETMVKDLLRQLRKLSLDDKELLRQCWHHLAKSKEDVAVDIFILIFKQCPETKKLFYFAMDDEATSSISAKRYKEDQALQFHALRFIQIVETMIDNIDDPRSVQPTLRNLGLIHLRFRDKFGFQPYFWSVFCECTLFVFRERLKHRTEDIDRAVILWRAVLGAIKQQMKRGFREGERKRRDIRRNTISDNDYRLVKAIGGEAYVANYRQVSPAPEPRPRSVIKYVK